MIIYSVVCIAVFGAWYKHMHGNAAPDSSKAGWLSAYSVAGIVILVPGLQFLSAYILTLTAGIFPDALTVYEELLESSGLDNSISAGMILYTVVLAPVSEELTFRGVSFGYFRKCLPFWAAAFFQALLFGLFHMNLIQGVYVFFIALFFAYVYERSRSIYCSILLHIMYNFWGTVIAPYISFGETLSSFVFWFIFSLAATVAGITLFDKGMQKKLKPDVVTEDDAQEL
jgi:hypothetical protein